MSSKKEEKKEPTAIELPKCELNPITGEVVCKVKEDLYDKIRQYPRVKKITFEVEAP